MSDEAPVQSNSAKIAVDVTVIIVNYNTAALLRPCIEALKTSGANISMQIIIIDNASRDDSAELMRSEFSDCDLIFNTVNCGFGRANNQALDRARGRYLLLLNTDAFVAEDTLGRTIGFMNEHADCGLLGVRLVGRDGVLQPSCRYFPTPWNEFAVATGIDRIFPPSRPVDDMAWDHASVRYCDWVPGCYYLIRRQVVDQVGLFDPRFFLYYEEVDHCKAIKAAGWQVVFYPHTTVVHIGGESAKSDSAITSVGRQISILQIESGLLYHRKNHGLAGLIMSVGLTTVGDIFLAIKWLVRRHTPREVGSFVNHTRTVWALLRKTHWATQPTR